MIDKSFVKQTHLSPLTIFQKNDIHVFINQLGFFMLKVTKIDGNFYSLMKFHYDNYFLYSHLLYVSGFHFNNCLIYIGAFKVFYMLLVV